ncbi:hypothetical protein AB0F88_37475 [Streptosporangium sp. NPDC023963]|uniref:hypothetical protein n=1 Tax=Streptosporangium sp. NPDC023963 TaxID=3155608 RepID=UPI0034279187
MTRTPHAITPACSIECLKPVLSARAYNPLTQAGGAPFDRPDTVADVIMLLRTGQLDQIWGLGPRRIGEIEVALVFAGLTRDHGGPFSDNL